MFANQNAGPVKVKEFPMASSPSKRRRTSVGTIQVSTSNKNFEPNESEPDGVPGPVSYMSPTKASLARSHPHLLPRTEEFSAPRSKGKLLLEQRISMLKSKQSSIISPSSSEIHPILQPAANAEDQEPRASPPEAEKDDFAKTAHSIQQAPVLKRTEEPQADHPAQESEEGSTAVVPSVSAPSDATALEKPTTLRDNIREITNHSDNDKVALPSTPVKNVGHEIDIAEPRLPSTPRQLGLEPPARKPTGPLSLSPKSKRKLRRPSSIKSSPLKPKEVAAVQQIVETQDESSLGLCRSFSDYATSSDIEMARQFPLSENHEDMSIADFATIPMRASKDLAVSDPLFNLQASLSLDLSASDEFEPMQAETNGLRSRIVMFSSTDGILVVKLRMFLKHGSNKVASIAVIQLSPWTSPELGSWLKAPVTDRSQGAIAKAISHYWDMAETRAFCWYNCEQDFAHLINNQENKTQNQNHPDHNNKSADNIDDGPQKPNPAAQEITDTDLVPDKASNIETQKTPSNQGDASSVPPPPPPPLLARQSLSFSDRLVLLHINWTIRFTPSGEALSVLSARASYPESWSGNAVFNDLARTSEAFATLVNLGKTVHQAVGSLIGVMFP